MGTSNVGRLTSRIYRPVLALLLSSALLGGCRTNSQDLQRWASSQHGPTKLVAVLLHDKYPLELRAEAALALIGMKPRAGQQSGIDRMIETLLRLPQGERTQLVAQLVPQLIAQMAKPPPTRAEQSDSTLSFKDAAFALLTHEEKTLLPDPAARTQVDAALTRWATTGFARRLDDTSQKYGLVQVMRHLGASGVNTLPTLIQPGVAKLDQITALIAELGDPQTKLTASQRLVALARDLESQRWLDATQSSLTQGPNPPTQERAREQATLQQGQELLQVFGAMKRLGQPPSVDYLLDLATDGSKPDERRVAALAALEGHLTPQRGPQLSRLYALADDPKTPALVRDLALRRMADLPRQEVISDLYRLFDSEQWKTRWLAAELVLRISDVKHLPEFMDHLESVQKLAMVEAKRYGALIAELKGAAELKGDRDLTHAVAKYAQRSQPLAVRLTALGYYLANGSDRDVRDVARHERDATPIPSCEGEGPECAWQCSFEQNGQPEEKGLTTLGDFVHFCVLPALRGRSGTPTPSAERPPVAEGQRPVQ
jgi:hypothetical protein